MTFGGQVHTVNLVEFSHTLAIQKSTAPGFGHICEIGCQSSGFFRTAEPHGFAARALLHTRTNVGRGDQQDVWAFAPGWYRSGFVDQSAHADADGGCVDTEAALGIVGPQHDNEQVYRLMAHQAGKNVVQAAQSLVDGIIENRSPAAEAFLQDPIVGA